MIQILIPGIDGTLIGGNLSHIIGCFLIGVILLKGRFLTLWPLIPHGGRQNLRFFYTNIKTMSNRQKTKEIVTTQLNLNSTQKLGLHENDFTPPPPPNTSTTHHHHPPQTQCPQYLTCSCPYFNQTLKVGL